MQQALSPLVKVTQHNVALLFCNYLKTLQIHACVKNEDAGFVIYCQTDMHVIAEQEFEQFIAQPSHTKYQQAAWNNSDVTQVSSDAPGVLSSFASQFFSHAGIVTLTIFTICWLVFLASNLGWGNAIFQQLHFYQQLSLDALFDAPQRLLGPAFFHFSWLHIVFNTMWWWQLGGSIEKAIGKFSLVNLLVVSALVSNLGQFLVDGPNFGGLSGVVYALVGYVWWMGWLMPEKGLSLSKPIIGFMLFWLLLGYTSLMPINVANTAHLLGLVSGCLLAFIAQVQSKAPKT